ncbi:hypothetical protein [Sphingobacterium humi]|uniref:Fibrobacter succinogenes major paralogous domain-containing protein n=1 Tax=Sphingobacterium humi TaxID=1796905 RepID=A0A6N8L2K7_9SPHI|nr:hypothetical protein [Sphingobacterium humi]MVZ63527.1 hypothetical protein [Sphingobacterium humi]
MNFKIFLPPQFFPSLLTLFILFTSSCSKSKNDNIQVSDGTTIKISVNGLADGGFFEELSASSRLSSSRKVKETNEEITISAGDVEALVYQIDKNLNSGKDEKLANKSEFKSEAKFLKSAISPLNNMVKYRLLIYDQNNNLVHNKVASVGTDPVLGVNKGWTYKWYSYSTNQTSGVPDINANGIVSKTGLSNKDVLYASGTISTVAGNNHLDILFKRKTSRIQTRINVRGMFGLINDGTSVSLVQSNSQGNPVVTMGDLNVYSGNFSNISSVNSSVSGADMQLDNATEGSSVKIANFYTLNISNFLPGSIAVNLAPLKIKLDDNRERTFNSLQFSLPKALEPQIGSTHMATLRLVESPILVKGVYWARTNLIYDAGKLDKYRLKSMPGGSDASRKDQDFWNWMAETPTSPSSNFDACSKLYPEGTWKMPTISDWQNMGQPDGKEERMGLFVGADYGFFWDKQASYPNNAAYDDNRLYISFGGYRTTSGNVSGSPAGILLGAAASGQCDYWSSSNHNTNQAKAVYSSMSKLFWIFSWGDISYPNRNKSEGRNVRCIRAKNNPIS